MLRKSQHGVMIAPKLRGVDGLLMGTPKPKSKKAIFRPAKSPAASPPQSSRFLRVTDQWRPATATERRRFLEHRLFKGVYGVGSLDDTASRYDDAQRPKEGRLGLFGPWTQRQGRDGYDGGYLVLEHHRRDDCTLSHRHRPSTQGTLEKCSGALLATLKACEPRLGTSQQFSRLLQLLEQEARRSQSLRTSWMVAPDPQAEQLLQAVGDSNLIAHVHYSVGFEQDVRLVAISEQELRQQPGAEQRVREFAELYRIHAMRISPHGLVPLDKEWGLSAKIRASCILLAIACKALRAVKKTRMQIAEHPWIRNVFRSIVGFVDIRPLVCAVVARVVAEGPGIPPKVVDSLPY